MRELFICIYLEANGKVAIYLGESFWDILELVQELETDLLNECKHPMRDMTSKRIRNLLGAKASVNVPGIFVIEEDSEFYYFGSTKDLARRIGLDFRSLTQKQAPITFELAIRKGIMPIQSRQYIYDNCTVSFLRVDSPKARALFTIYAAIKYNTSYNTF